MTVRNAKLGNRPGRSDEEKFAEATAKEAIRRYAKSKGKGWKEPKKKKGNLGKWDWMHPDEHTKYINKAGIKSVGEEYNWWAMGGAKASPYVGSGKRDRMTTGDWAKVTDYYQSKLNKTAKKSKPKPKPKPKTKPAASSPAPDKPYENIPGIDSYVPRERYKPSDILSDVKEGYNYGEDYNSGDSSNRYGNKQGLRDRKGSVEDADSLLDKYTFNIKNKRRAALSNQISKIGQGSTN